MPRRKAPKKVSKARRSSIKVEIDQSVPEDERKRKLDAFISDFENQQASRLMAIRDSGEELLSKLDRLFQAELLKMPQSVREMKFVEFSDTYGYDVNSVLLQSTQAELDKIKVTKTIRKPRKTKKMTTMFDTIDENEAPDTVVRAKAPPSVLQTGRMTRTAAKVKPPTWADTPLVTPAFNPRLCRTKATERCTMVLDMNSPKIEIPVNGKNIVLNKESELDEESRSVLQTMSQMINALLIEK